MAHATMVTIAIQAMAIAGGAIKQQPSSMHCRRRTLYNMTTAPAISSANAKAVIGAS